jgi:peptidyl-prolyl cis-trans isomerase B (cyclophilin B)
VASTRNRQRKLERQRYERKLVRLAQKQRRKRQLQAGVGAFVALALIVLGAAWLAGVFESEPEPLADPPLCSWLPRDPADHPDRIDVGTPPEDPPTSGARTMAIELDAGDSGSGRVEVRMDVTADPCTAASMEHLAAQGFFDDTVCHELAEGALRCGDPGGTGEGGPSYAFWGTNLPAAPQPEEGGSESEPAVLYPAGTVALGDAAGENGSQFLIFYEDYAPENPVYPLVGTVTAGLDVVEAIGEAGVEEGTTTPVEEVRIETLTVTDAAEAPVR